MAKSNLGKATSYAINQWPNLETYLSGVRVEICNNLIENAILCSLVKNCHRSGNPKEYLEDMLTLMPGNWLKPCYGKEIWKAA